MNYHRPRAAACACVLSVALASLWNSAPAADGPSEPLHRRIDRLLDADRIGPPVAPASDAEFLRRLSLDLTGMPPSVEELRTFLGDTAPDKRARVVDRLLDSPLFTRHWATTLDVMLMERRTYQNVTKDQWENYLLTAVREDRPLNRVIGEILRADGSDPKNRGPARFYLDRDLEPNAIARDVGRIFFGRDMQCAHCHDHPLIEDYRQSDYYGLLAFFTAGYDPSPPTATKKTTYPEKAATDLPFDSVFVKDDHHLTGPRLPGGTELAEPVFPPGEEYKVKPTDKVMPVPRHSRRAMLASLATGGTNRAFNENIANRLWAVMMGRGLVHPVDLNHPANPPSHPELSRLLGEEIAALKFDVKPFLRELALSSGYQRAIDLPGAVTPLPARFAADLAELKAHSEPLEAAAARTQDDYAKAVKAWHRAEAVLIPMAAEQDKALVKHAGVMKKEDEAGKALAAAQAAVAAHRETAKALADAAGRTQDVVKKLPKEKALADAARVFTNRSAAAKTELTALEKASGEKATALKRIGEERAAVAKVVESARAKAQPVRESVRRQESVALEARRKVAECRIALEHQQKRVASLEAYARWHGLREQIAANRHDVEARRLAIVAAKRRAGEQASVLQRRVEEAKSPEQARIAAETAKTAAETGLEHHRKTVSSVDAALAATRAAQQLLPDDATVSEAARKLAGKADELKSAVPSLKGQVDAARAALVKAETAAARANEAVKAAGTEQKRREDALALAQKDLATVETRAAALRTEVVEATDELASLLGSRFALAQLKPLSPEQMCWSILEVTGVYDRYRKIEEAALAKAKPLTGAAVTDPAARRSRAIEVEQRTFDKLKGNLPAFISVYAAGAGQPQNDFFATADQALFAANGGPINGWIAPAGGNVTERMIGEKDPRKAAEDLYMTILSRAPADDESADVVRMLSVPAKEKPAVVQELVWGLLTSAEFRFNH